MALEVFVIESGHTMTKSVHIEMIPDISIWISVYISFFLPNCSMLRQHLIPCFQEILGCVLYNPTFRAAFEGEWG